MVLAGLAAPARPGVGDPADDLACDVGEAREALPAGLEELRELSHTSNFGYGGAPERTNGTVFENRWPLRGGPWVRIPPHREIKPNPATGAGFGIQSDAPKLLGWCGSGSDAHVLSPRTVSTTRRSPGFRGAQAYLANRRTCRRSPPRP
jgi:hypothetical protein